MLFSKLNILPIRGLFEISSHTIFRFGRRKEKFHNIITTIMLLATVKEKVENKHYKWPFIKDAIL